MTDYLWTSFITNGHGVLNSSGNNVLVCASPDGATWRPNLDVNQASGFAPSLALFNNRLYVAFIANDSGQNVLVCSTADALNWAPLNGTPGANSDIHQASGSAPSLAAFKGRLYVAFISNDSNQNVLVCSSANGAIWEPLNGRSGSNPDIGQASNGSAPSLAVSEDGNTLWLAFIANNGGNNILVCSSPDGGSWSGNSDIHQASNGSAPSLTVFQGRLYVAFIANDSGQNVLVCSSANGGAFEPANGTPGATSDIHQASNGTGPSLAVFDGRLYVAFISNDSNQNVLVCSSADGAKFLPLNGGAATNPDINQASELAPSLAVAPFSYWPNSPTGLTSTSNYFFFRNDHAPIYGLSVKITLSEDMVFDAASGEYTGFSFQLNSYSLNNPKCAWQQYVVNYVNDELTGIINNWPENPTNQQDSICNHQQGMLSVPGGRLTKGTTLTITLQYEPKDNSGAATVAGTVTGATFEVPNAPLLTMENNLPANQMAPIVAFTLNIVGTFNLETSVLTSGAGVIEYSAANGLASQIGLPGWIEFQHFTGESANTFYGKLPSALSNPFSQVFKVGSIPS